MIIRADGHVLLQKRPAGKPHAGLWEFPGGKVESDENQRDALARELKEELAIVCDTASMKPLTFAEFLPENPIVLFLYKVTDWTGDLEPLPGAEIAWLPVSALHDYAMPPLDVQLAHRIIALGETVFS